MPTRDDEKTLLTAIAGGDRAAFKSLYTHYLEDVFRYIYLFTKSKETGEEIVQAVFVKIWEKRQALTEVQSFKSYLFRCAKNHLLDEIRRNNVGAKVMRHLKSDTTVYSHNADEKLVYDQYCQIAQKAIDLLPAKRRQIVILRTRDEFSFDEIAAFLSISKSVVKKQLYAGVMFIRSYMKKHGEFDL
jgi:RNA polymerase sigma-70 factor (ECF subfamily)